MLKPSNGKDPKEPKNDRFVSKTYTFDVIKCDEIFDLLVNEGIMIVPKGLKLPPIEQRQKKGYCKFHGNFGHKTSRCVVFRDSVQKALDEGMLKFGQTKATKADSRYLEVAGMEMVEIFEIDSIMATDGLEVDIEMTTEGHKCADTVITEDQYEENIQVVFPKAEDLIDFLNICKNFGSPVMLCPRCSVFLTRKQQRTLRVFDFNRSEKENGLTKGLSLVSKKQTFLSRTHPQLQTRRRDQRKPSLLPPNPQIIN